MRIAMFRRFAAYNRWSNDRLYAACGELALADYHAGRPAFFGSIHRTLSHILVADRLWSARIRGEPAPGLSLDQELYADRAELAGARSAEDAMIEAFVGGLAEGDLDQAINYRTTAGQPFTNPLELILQHLFNHQTHHRGQVHDMLVATTVAPPPLDLIDFERNRKAAA